MECKEVRNYIQLFIDSELDAKTNHEVSEHLSICEKCNIRFTQEQKIEKGLVSILSINHDPVEEVRDIRRIWGKTVSAINKQEGTNFRMWWLQRRYLIPAIPAFIAIIFYLMYNLSFLGHNDLIIAAGECHSEYMKNKVVPTIETQIPEEVISYFSEKFDFTIKLPFEGGNKNKLVGARLCYLKRVPVAYAMYNCNNIPLSLFFIGKDSFDNFPDAKKLLNKHGTMEWRNIYGNNLVAISSKDTIVCAVSEMDLQSIRNIIKNCGQK